MKGMPNDWLLEGLEKSGQILDLVLSGVTQEEAQTIRDGAEGWSVLEIMCHLRDYQDIFATRIRRMLEEDNPMFELYDEAARMAMVVENDYAKQNLRSVVADFRSTRRELINRLSSLRDDQWNRVGSFAEDDEVDIAMPVAHTMLHDGDHTEQIARILRQ